MLDVDDQCQTPVFCSVKVGILFMTASCLARKNLSILSLRTFYLILLGKTFVNQRYKLLSQIFKFQVSINTFFYC